MANGRVVEFYEISDSRSVLNEIDDDLTTRQFAQFERQVERLERHGHNLDADYFGRVKGAAEKLQEFRLSLQDIDYRVLFADEDGVLLMLCGYVEKRNKIPAGKIASAVARLRGWRQRDQ